MFQNVTRSNEIGTFDPKYLRSMQQVIPRDTADEAIDRASKFWTPIIFTCVVVFGGAAITYGISLLP